MEIMNFRVLQLDYPVNPASDNLLFMHGFWQSNICSINNCFAEIWLTRSCSQFDYLWSNPPQIPKNKP